jgi:pyridoxal 5'-phosphate synthase pdxT subunit
MTVGVLALQGDVPEHLRVLRTLLRDPIAVRTTEDLAAVEALFLPGGESTTIARLIEEAGLWSPLRERIDDKLPVLATCAGLILLARVLAPSATGRDPPTFGALDVTVRRNDFGSQRESCEAPLTVEGLGKPPFPGVFIRSPRILSVGPEATPIAWRGDEVVGVRAGRLWGLTFHPELSDDLRVHRKFLSAAGVRAQTR